ncbi:MAG: A/G-specific adenine glycosylase [Pseudomonadota bacterium]|nr:A/G-specific adenine glycosylase [Pseudomonadota bacterium]
MLHSRIEKLNPRSAVVLADLILEWYDQNRRAMPWRSIPGSDPDPYHVWLSEVMLQQTTVATVVPYFRTFLQRWATVRELAAANLDAVLHAWQGLGYYARARNLHKCAKIICAQHAGRFPDTESELLKLPGIGQYTAAAIAAIAFGRKSTVVDGNVERVMARLYAVKNPLPKARTELRKLAARHTPGTRCGDYAQAVMDLGATICSPSKPACAVCPWTKACVAKQRGIAADLPVKAPKPKRPVRYGFTYWMVSPEGSVLLRRRPTSGLLGGMMEVPSTTWTSERRTITSARGSAPMEADWVPLAGVVHHRFSHFDLQLRVLVAGVAKVHTLEGVWCFPESFNQLALPTVMKKVIKLVTSNK